MTGDLLFWSIPPLIALVGLLGVRRFSRLNIARQVGGLAIVYAALGLGMNNVLDAPILVLLGAIGGTLVGQAYEAERQRAAERRRGVGLDKESVSAPIS